MNPFESLKDVNPDKVYKLLDYADIYKKQLMQLYPDWNGSLRSLTHKEMIEFIKKAKL